MAASLRDSGTGFPLRGASPHSRGGMRAWRRRGSPWPSGNAHLDDAVSLSRVSRTIYGAATMNSTPIPPSITRAQEKWILAATIIASTMAFSDMTIVNVALPILQESLGASFSAVQWVVE